MKIILIETDGGLHDVDITEEEIAFYLGGVPLTFCGTIQELDIVVMIKEDSTNDTNPYVIPGIKRFRGRALIIQTDDNGDPIDIDKEVYHNWVGSKI